MAGRTLVFYDSQCETCQAGVSWLRLLDGHGRTACLPIEAGAVARCRDQGLRDAVGSAGRIIDILKQARHPVLLVSVSDQVKRLMTEVDLPAGIYGVLRRLPV